MQQVKRNKHEKKILFAHIPKNTIFFNNKKRNIINMNSVRRIAAKVTLTIQTSQQNQAQPRDR